MGDFEPVGKPAGKAFPPNEPEKPALAAEQSVQDGPHTAMDTSDPEKFDPQPRYSVTDIGSGGSPVYDSTHRTLKPRHIQLIGIGGTIGTALYVQIGQGLLHGGPGSLFLAFTFW